MLRLLQFGKIMFVFEHTLLTFLNENYIVLPLEKVRRALYRLRKKNDLQGKKHVLSKNYFLFYLGT